MRKKRTKRTKDEMTWETDVHRTLKQLVSLTEDDRFAQEEWVERGMYSLGSVALEGGNIHSERRKDRAFSGFL